MQLFTIALAWLPGFLPFSNWFTDYSYLQAGPQQATAFALIYGFPLYSYTKLASNIEDRYGKFITNTFYHQTELANASFADINRPNVDTLYSEALVDLSTYDLIVTIPTVPSGRFYVFPFYDLYGNNFANLGTVNNTTPGTYLVTYRASHPGTGDGDHSYDGYIYSPTPYGAIDLRIEVYNTSDVQTVNELQVQFELATTQSSLPQVAPTLTKYLLFDGFYGNDATRLLQLTARLSPYNPPEVPRDVSYVTAILELAGLTGGSYTTPTSVNLTLAAEEAALAVYNVRHERAKKNFRDLGNGWSQLRDRLSGDFKSHYVVRAFVAAQGYLQLKADQAIYPIYDVSTYLLANTTYNVTFYGKPQVTGFWSLTVYYASNASLVYNPLDRYALGDRSDITYPNGSYVYGSEGSPADSTAPFSFYLQTQDITPPEEYYSNWLPTPSGDETFGITLRWYGPTEELQTKYEYPSVAIIDSLAVTSKACRSQHSY